MPIRMLPSHPRRYIASNKAKDLLLCQFVRDFMRGNRTNRLGCFADRNRTFDDALRNLDRGELIVEIGSMRSEEDWAGAGFSTYAWGLFASQVGLDVVSIDIGQTVNEFAKKWTEPFGDSVNCERCDGLEWLRNDDRKIGLLYLDGLDSDQPGHEESCLAMAQAAYRRCKMILIDDTPYRADRREWCGKGKTTVPWLLANNYSLMRSGYQVLLWNTQCE